MKQAHAVRLSVEGGPASTEALVHMIKELMAACRWSGTSLSNRMTSYDGKVGAVVTYSCNQNLGIQITELDRVCKTWKLLPGDHASFQSLCAGVVSSDAVTKTPQ